MTSLNNDAKRAAIVVAGGVSAVVCASAAFYYLKSKNNSKPEQKGVVEPVNDCVIDKENEIKQKITTEIKESKKSGENLPELNNNNNNSKIRSNNRKASNLSSSSQSMSSEDEFAGEILDSSKNSKINAGKKNKMASVVTRGGRKNYRALKKFENFDNNVVGLGQTDEEANARRLAEEFSSKINFSPSSDNRTPRLSQDATDSMDGGHSPSPKGQCADSPSLNSDGRSEASQDSGKGASTAFTSSISPVEELIEIPPVYEFEIPQDIVGLVIGTKGQTIKWFTGQSGAQMIIRRHYASDRHKICTIEGTREQINKCLRLIRRKFPPSRFPELKLTPLITPAVSSSKTPVCDSIIRLSLPMGIKCETVVSSLVDPSTFFLQQPTHPTFPSLSRLDQCMLAVYSQMLGVPGLPRPIDIGVICAAPVLGGWYRAQTMETFDDTDDVLVKFVDYGGYSKIQANDLRQIRSDLMSLPFQSNDCTLAHVKPIDESTGWSNEAISFFETCTQGKVVEAFVVNQNADNVTSVELYYFLDSDSSELVMINRLLVDNGFAIWQPDNVTNNDVALQNTPTVPNYFCPQFA